MSHYLVINSCCELEKELCSQLIATGHKVTLLGLTKPALDLTKFIEIDLTEKHTFEDTVSSLDDTYDGIFNIACMPAVINDPNMIFEIGFLGPKRLVKMLIPKLNQSAAIINLGAQQANQQAENIQLMDALFCPDKGSNSDMEQVSKLDPQAAFILAKQATIKWTQYLSVDVRSRGMRAISVSPDCAQISKDFEFGKTINQHHLEELVGILIALATPTFKLVNGVDICVDGGVNANYRVSPSHA